MKYIILCLLITFIVVKADKCGGNCPSGNCPSCKCGTTANKVDTEEICNKHTWNKECCKCIINKESSKNANAMNYGGGKYYVGLFQISEIHWKSCNGENAPCDSESNVNCAIEVYKAAGDKWKPWSTASKCKC